VKAWANDPSKDFWFWNEIHTVAFKGKLIHPIRKKGGDRYKALVGNGEKVFFRLASITDPALKPNLPSEYIGVFCAFWNTDKAQWQPSVLDSIDSVLKVYNSAIGDFTNFRPADSLPLDSAIWPVGVEFGPEDIT